MPDKEEKKPVEEISVVDEEKDVSSVSEEEETPKETGKKAPSRFDVAAMIRKFSVKTWITIILVMVALILLMIFQFHRNFRVQQIHVVGNHRFSEEQILDLADVHIGDHLYAHVGGSLSDIAHLQFGKARNRIINSDPYIADAKVYPHYPGEVYIEVTERRTVAYVAIPDGYAIISEDSVVLEIETGDVPTGIPEIRGLPIRSAQIGKKLDLTSSDGYDICITILGAILGADSSADGNGDDFDFLSHVICVRYCENMTTFIDLDIPGVLHTISVKIGTLQSISDDMNWLRYAIVSGYFADKSGTVLDMTGRQYILR